MPKPTTLTLFRTAAAFVAATFFSAALPAEVAAEAPKPPAQAQGIAAKILAGEKGGLRFGPYGWRVLEVRGDRALLITDEVVETRSYHSVAKRVTWEASEMRKYLNGEFLKKFTAGELGQIAATKLKNPKHPQYGTDGGRDTTDRVFLISDEEAYRYFGNDGDRDTGVYWWLRSPGFTGRHARVVRYGGEVDAAGGFTEIELGLRPALWITLDAGAGETGDGGGLQAPEAKAGPDGLAAQIQAGQKRDLRFGPYKWRVLTARGDRALIVTEEITEKRAYHGSNAEVTWETCDLRGYLNGEFLKKFNGDELKTILRADVKNPDNQRSGAKGGRATADKVFVLSLDEAKQFFESNVDRGAGFEGRTHHWWLRSPGDASNNASFVSVFGEFIDSGCLVGGREIYGDGVEHYPGVRPALWVSLGKPH